MIFSLFAYESSLNRWNHVFSAKKKLFFFFLHMREEEQYGLYMIFSLFAYESSLLMRCRCRQDLLGGGLFGGGLGGGLGGSASVLLLLLAKVELLVRVRRRLESGAEGSGLGGVGVAG